MGIAFLMGQTGGKKKAAPAGGARPADWIALPELVEGDQKVAGLHAVYPHGSNFVAFTCAGAYTVNWGDGTVEDYASGATAYHVFNYADFGAETECERGYRQAIVTITPQSGQNLTSVNFNAKHNQAGLPDGYSTGWLDVKAAGANISMLAFNSYTTVVRSEALEMFEFVGSNNINDFRYMFKNCSSFRTIVQLNTSKGTQFNEMFYGCYSLQFIPLLDTSSGLNFGAMFNGCRSLQFIPLLNTSNGAIFTDILRNCSSLQSIPPLDTSKGTVLSYMVGNCRSLSVGALSGTAQSISYSSCRLSRQALVDIFNGLATVTGKTITITGNWGAADLTEDDRAIATNKGWTITG